MAVYDEYKTEHSTIRIMDDACRDVSREEIEDRMRIFDGKVNSILMKAARRNMREESESARTG